MYNHLFKTKIFALVIAITLFSFLGFNNVSAAEDISITVSGQVNQYDNVFSNCTGDCLNDYQYLILEANSDVGYDTFVLWLRFDGSFTRSFILSTFRYGTTYNIYKLPFNGSSNNFLQWSNNFYFDSDLKLTLTDSLPGSSAPTGSLSITENGTFDVSEVASVNVNVPQDVTEIIDDPVSNDFHKIFMVVVAGVIPAFAVFVIVWFAIDLMSSLFFGRGK